MTEEHQGWRSDSQAPPVGSASRGPLTALQRTAALALAGSGVVYVFQFFFVWIVRGGPLLPILLLGVAALALAGLALLGYRWAPAAGALLALVGLAIELAIDNQTLIHPTAQPGRFVTSIVQSAFLVVALVAGAVIAIPALRPPPGGQSPRWLVPLLTGIAGLAVGMILIALVAAANPVGGPATGEVNGTPAVHMAGVAFTTNVVLVPKGDRLTLVDDDGMEHVIRNGSWTPGGTPRPQVEPGVPVVDLDIKGGSATTGPFTTPGIYHLYCAIHRGMNLTVVVQ